jgi:predicted dehydrogenase
VHVLDLLGWWLGDPTKIRYADDAMGGIEANAFVQLAFANGAHGRIHLSRDWTTAQEYRLVFERGIVTWNGHDANGLMVQIAGTPAAVAGTLVNPLVEPPAAATPRALESAVQCFILQLGNILGAIAGEESLMVPGDQGAFTVRLIEQCYRHRRLIEQRWLTPDEAVQAGELGRAVASTA